MKVQLSKLEKHPGGLDGGTADPEEHRGANQVCLGLWKLALILVQRALEMVDLSQDQRIGDGSMAHELANVLEMLAGLSQIASRPAGVRHPGGREGEQVEGVHMPWGVVNDDAGELGEIESFPGIGRCPPAALLDQPLGEDGTPEAAAGAPDADEALGRAKREELRQVPFGLPRLLQEIGCMAAEDGGNRLQHVFVPLPGRLLLAPRLDLQAADGTKALEMMGLDPGEGALGQLAASHGAEQLAGDVDVAQRFWSMEFRFSS
jgi:hypothetical protein